jgi:hypothetical protein
MKSMKSYWVAALVVTLGSASACSSADPEIESSISLELIGGTTAQREKWLGNSAIRVQGSQEDVRARLLRATQELLRLERVPGARLLRMRVDGHAFDISEAAFADVRPALQRALVKPSTGLADPDLGCTQQALAITNCCAGLVPYCTDQAAELDGRPGCLWCCDE